MDIVKATRIIRNHFTQEDCERAPATVIDSIRGEVVSEAFIVYCKEKGYYKEYAGN